MMCEARKLVDAAKRLDLLQRGLAAGVVDEHGLAVMEETLRGALLDIETAVMAKRARTAMARERATKRKKRSDEQA